MKLLKLRIENNDGFRSLQKDFEINFHTLTDTNAMESFRPFCFVGLNGSGKSNVLEAIANIFYHLEICVAKYKPESIGKVENFNRAECTPNAFTLEYLIGQHNQNPYALVNFHKVVINKKEGQEPGIKVYEFPFKEADILIPNPKLYKSNAQTNLINSSGKLLQEQDKIYLPDHIIGYSSGENEILSLPFIKSRLIHLDEYRQASRDNYERFEEPENSLIYIDNNMSQAVLLSCLLFETDETLAPLRDVDNTGILGIRSFRMNIGLHDFIFEDGNKKITRVPILNLIDQHQINNLKKSATSWFFDQATKTLWLDFYVNEATKLAFREYFNNSFECFQFFRLLYELNSHFLDESTKEKIYQSKGVYTDWKLPTGAPDHDFFHFLDFYVSKELKDNRENKDLLLRSFSDGEHQFLHTMGICLLLKDRRSILLLDEPDTHFNPNWRSKFIKILGDSVTMGNHRNLPHGSFNVHLLKDILLTSHSPFIISDCLPDNVIFFKKNEETKKLETKKASQLELNTYGSSVDYILKNFFKTNLISKKSFEELKEIIDNGTIDQLREAVDFFGESSEKQFLFKKIYEKMHKKDDN